MMLKTRTWGSGRSRTVVCLHGITQHGGVFDSLARHLASLGCFVVALDLRGHGGSGDVPPWNTETHVQDVLETLDAMEIGPITLIGHSFGGRLAAAIAAACEERVKGLVLLDPGLAVPADLALAKAEIERLDWSFATIDGAVNALLSNGSIVAAPRDVVETFVRDDVRQGADGRFRFRFCPSAAVVAWSEVTLPAPPIARVSTLLVLADTSLVDGSALAQRYGDALGPLLTAVTVPNGHNLLWESPVETIEAIERFLPLAPEGP